ncbi:MAG: hypothetical protein GC151_12335 [Betaproteobacteria bacterium]|nr:hypothetical protein [Betaproteobacteria bacterium]
MQHSRTITRDNRMRQSSHPGDRPRFTGTLRSLALAMVLVPVAHAAPGSPPRKDAFRVQSVDVIDRQGFERPMRAAGLMLPAGWRVQSGMAWPRQRECGVLQPLPVVRADAPDGRGVIELLPGENWGFTFQGAAMPTCPFAPWADTANYLQGWVQRHRPGARWLGFKPRPDKSVPEQVQSYGMIATGTRIETGQALISYDADGRSWNELLAVSVRFTRNVPQDPALRHVGNVTGQSMGVLAWRVPTGEPPQRRFDAIWETLRLDPAWAQRIAQANASMNRQDAETAGRISRIQSETAREVMEMRQRGFENRGAMRDAGQANAVRGIGEVDAWQDPDSGHAVELSQNYRHAWKLRDGTYVLSDDPDLNPERDLGVPGEPLRRAR